MTVIDIRTGKKMKRKEGEIEMKLEIERIKQELISIFYNLEGQIFQLSEFVREFREFQLRKVGHLDMEKELSWREKQVFYILPSLLEELNSISDEINMLSRSKEDK